MPLLDSLRERLKGISRKMATGIDVVKENLPSTKTLLAGLLASTAGERATTTPVSLQMPSLQTSPVVAAPAVTKPTISPIVPATVSPSSQIQKGITDTGAQIAALQKRVRTEGITPTTVTTPTISTEQDILDALSAMTEGTDYKKQMTDLIAGLQQSQESYLSTLKNLPSTADLYTQYRTQLGLPEKEAALTTTQQQIQKTEDLLTNLESDIGARVSDVGTAVSEPLRRRLLATEQAPITKQLQQLGSVAGIQETGLTSAREQLSELLSMAQSEQGRQATLAKAPLEYAQQLFPTLASLAEYQTPKEKLVNEIIKQMVLQRISPEEAEAPETIGTAETGLLQWNPDTESWEYITQPVTKKTVDEDKLLSPSEAENLGVPYGTTQSEAAEKGIVPGDIKKRNELLLGIDQAKTGYSMLQDSVKTLGTVAFGPQARLRGYSLKKLTLLGLADNAKIFMDQRDALKQLFTNIFNSGGGRGLRYTLANVEGILPNIGDSTSEVLKKMQNLATLINELEGNIYKTYGGETTARSGGGTSGATSTGLKYTIEY